MEFAVNYFSMPFTADNSKDAYLEACEWVAKNIMSKSNKNIDLKDTYWKIERDEKEPRPTFILRLYASLNQKDFENHFCTICKETHTAFYINSGYNCNSCKMQAFLGHAKQKLRVKKNYRKGLVQKRLDEEFEF